MQLTSNLFHLLQDGKNLSETYTDLKAGPIFCVLCDALFLPNPEQNASFSKEFEKVIRKYLSFQRQDLTEKTLLKALDQAQKHFFKNYAKQAHQLKISALIILELPPQKTSPRRQCLICGLGDFKVLSINKPSSILFYDTATPRLPLSLSLKKRFNYLKNTIGMPQIKAHVQKMDLTKIQSLLVLSYGTYNSIPEEKWVQLSMDFTNKKSQIVRSLTRSKEKEHFKQLVYLSLKKKSTETLSESAANTPLNLSPPKGNYHDLLNWIQWGSKILIVLILGLCIFELTQKTPFSKAGVAFEKIKSPIKQPHMDLNIRSIQRPTRFPIVREQAYVVDLKEKNERQKLVIERLNEKIRLQDQSLRDMQVKYTTSNFQMDQQDPESL